MDAPIVPQKRCSKCGQEYPATTEYFMPHKGKLYCQCHECRRASKRDSHVRNREHNNARTKRWVDANQDRVIAYRQEYYVENREVIIQRMLDWQKANPGKANAKNRQWLRVNRHNARAINQKKRGRRRMAEGSFTQADIETLYSDQEGRCLYCGITLHNEYHIDHIHPLSRGGSNWPDNIGLTCATCNLSKGDKLVSEWTLVRGW